MPRNWEFQPRQVDANRADGLPNWKFMQRRTIWFTWKNLGCIRMPIPAAKTGIPGYMESFKNVRPRLVESPSTKTWMRNDATNMPRPCANFSVVAESYGI